MDSTQMTAWPVGAQTVTSRIETRLIKLYQFVRTNVLVAYVNSESERVRTELKYE
jgi:hypothetical protein